MRRRLLTLFTTTLLVLGACGDDGAGGTLRVSDAWSRASAGGQLTGVVYFELAAGGTGDALIEARVSADIAGSAEIHETVETSTTMAGHEMGGTTMSGHELGGTTMAGHDMGGTMTMQPVSAVHLAAGETVSFEPGGYHVMLMGLMSPLEVGETFEVTLVFEHAGEIVVTAEVRE